MSVLLYEKEVEMLAFPVSHRPYYSPDHARPDQDFASVAAHAEAMAALRSVIKTPLPPFAHRDYGVEEKSFDAHIEAIHLVTRAAKGALAVVRSALADRFSGGSLPDSEVIKPDVIYTDEVIYVRKAR